MNTTISRRHPLALAVSLALAAGSVQAATLTVNSTADTVANDAQCTLREAVQAITDSTNENGCSNSSGDAFGINDTIVFAASLSTPITVGLQNNELKIKKSMTITGPVAGEASGLVIKNAAGAGHRVLHVFKGPSVALNNLTLTGGYLNGGGSGGGLWANDHSSVTLTHCTVSDNSSQYGGGGVFARDYSVVTLIDSTVSENKAPRGGGLFTNSGSEVTLARSTVSGNSASIGGGGVYAESGTVTLTSSTVSGNTASSLGGGVFVASGTVTLASSTVSGNTASIGGGGGVYADSSAVTLVNATVAYNSASRGGGVYAYDSSTVLLTNSTVSHNHALSEGGGLLTYDATVTLNNTILAGNEAPTDPDLNFKGSNNVSASHSLLAAALNSSPYNAAADHNLFTDNPGLGALTDNGGPTQTMALLAGSPAIDKGSNALAVGLNNQPLQYDQRGNGYPRIVNGIVDIGAYEWAPPPQIPTLSVWGVGLLSGVLGLACGWARRRGRI